METLNKYNIATKGTIPASESFSFRNTGKWSGVATMSQRASNTYGSFENGIQLQLEPAIKVALGRIEIIFYYK